MEKVCFGIDVGGTTVKLGLFTTEGQLLDKWEIPTRTARAGEAILPDIAASVLLKMKEHSVDASCVAGLGLDIPGPVCDGKTSGAVNLYWGPKDLVGELSGLTGGLVVRAGNDANVAAMGEYWMGAAKGYRDVFMVTLGTGVGGGIISNGRILEGAHGAGGEIGHIHVDNDLTESCNCGAHGCLEQFCSATGIVRMAKEELAQHPEILTELRADTVTSKAVFDAEQAGDALASRVTARFAKYLGIGIASACNMVDPEIVVVGGGVSKAGQGMIDAVVPHFRAYAFPACRDTPIVLARLGNDAGIYGAAKLVLGA